MTVHTLAVVGAKFRPPAVGLLRVLPTGSPLTLRREPSNAYDSNAIRVLVSRETFARVNTGRLLDAVSGFGMTMKDLASTSEWHLGYVPRTEALTLAPLMDSTGAIELTGELTFGLNGQTCVRADFPGD